MSIVLTYIYSSLYKRALKPLQQPFRSLPEAFKAFKTDFNLKSLRYLGNPSREPILISIEKHFKISRLNIFVFIYRFIHIYIYISYYVLWVVKHNKVLGKYYTLSSIMTPQDLGGQSGSIVIPAGGQSGGQSRGVRRPPGPK